MLTTLPTTVMKSYDCTFSFRGYFAESSHELAIHVSRCHKQRSHEWLPAKEQLATNVKVTFTNNMLSKNQQLNRLKWHHIEHESDALQQGSVPIELPAKPMDVPAFESAINNCAWLAPVHWVLFHICPLPTRRNISKREYRKPKTIYSQKMKRLKIRALEL